MKAADDRLTTLSAGEPRSADDLVASLGLRTAAHDRAYVVAAMITSADGRATVSGRSTGLGNPGDRALLRALRAGVDAVLVGAATIRAERYADPLDPGPRAARVAAGRPPLPTIATISRSGDVPWEVGLFGDPDAHVVVFGDAVTQPPATTGARVTCEPGAALDGVIARLYDGYGARAILCEGGPTLLRALVAAGLLDALFLTVAPLLVAGDGPAPLTGEALDPIVGLELAAVHRSGDHAILQYQRS